jgi:hypothetical protein
MINTSAVQTRLPRRNAQPSIPKGPSPVFRRIPDSDTLREFRASLWCQRRASTRRELSACVAGTLIHPPCREMLLRGPERCNAMWRDGVSPVSSGARTKQVRTAIKGWTTAESSATDRGADHKAEAALMYLAHFHQPKREGPPQEHPSRSKRRKRSGIAARSRGTRQGRRRFLGRSGITSQAKRSSWCLF